MFINVSNHPTSKWGEEQLKAAQAYGDVVDIPFPAISPSASDLDLKDLANQYLDRILGMLSGAENERNRVHIMGEMGFTFILVAKLMDRGIFSVHSTTERRVTENPDGSKTVEFRFVQFRDYPFTNIEW